MKILFMGTPEIAAVCLRALAQKHEICGVFCQPDKPVGRKAILTAPPVKQTAQQLGFCVYQPTKLRDGSAAELIRGLDPDMIAVVAYGRILPEDILNIPKYGCVNIHASLLPKYRGAAPIQRALINGESETGVCAMYMAAGMDTGDVIEERRCAITDDDDAVTMFDKLGEIGAQLLCDTADAIQNGVIRRTPQNDAAATVALMLEKSEGLFGWHDAARDIFNKARGMVIWPNAFFMCDGKKIKLMKSRALDKSGAPGEVLSLDPLTVAAGSGSVELLEVKPEGSRLMTGREWAAGRRLKVGAFLPEE